MGLMTIIAEFAVGECMLLIRSIRSRLRAANISPCGRLDHTFPNKMLLEDGAKT
jgi:hypothetical protein